MSNADPEVERVQVPVLGAVQTHQTDFAGALPAWLGSPTSEVPSTLLPERVQEEPVTLVALAKESFPGRMGWGGVAVPRDLARFIRPPDLVFPDRDPILSVPLSSRLIREE